MICKDEHSLGRWPAFQQDMVTCSERSSGVLCVDKVVPPVESIEQEEHQREGRPGEDDVDSQDEGRESLKRFRVDILLDFTFIFFCVIQQMIVL